MYDFVESCTENGKHEINDTKRTVSSFDWRCHYCAHGWLSIILCVVNREHLR